MLLPPRDAITSDTDNSHCLCRSTRMQMYLQDEVLEVELLGQRECVVLVFKDSTKLLSLKVAPI